MYPLSSSPHFPWHSPLHTKGSFLPVLVTLPKGFFFFFFMVRRLCLAPKQNKLERPECQNSSIDGRLGSVHKFSSFLAIQVGQLWDMFHTAVSKNYERLWNRQKRWIQDAVWQPLGLCLFSKGVQLGQSLTRYSTTLQRHMLIWRVLIVKPMFPTHDKVNGFLSSRE